ncbi:MAG: XdhC family protein, partial [Thermoleophilia bacterium]|nr:XdhC family protein [Thermoleophilia bacterium]
MRELAAEIERWRSRGRRIAVATVVATRRSAPRPVGAKLAVSDAGELAGSVSGGCVEAEVAAHAAEVLAGGPPRLLSYGIADDLAFEIGLPCGGEIDVFVAVPADEVLTALLELPPDSGRAAHLSVVAGEGLGRELVVLPDGRRAGDDALAGFVDAPAGLVALERATVFVDVHAPAPRLLVFGAVDTAEEL